MLRLLALAVLIKTLTAPYIRAPEPLDHLRLDPKGRFAAYLNTRGLGLSILDLKSQAISQVSTAQVGASFFWSPDGYRLFYRELANNDKGEATSTIKAFDAYLGRSVTIDGVSGTSGILTFDPRDLRMQLMTAAGIRTKRIYFPDERLARWQVAQRNERGKWLATQKGLLWVTQGGYAMRKLDDDGTGLESFELSPDGTTAAWATAGGQIFVSKNGTQPKFISYGRDPRWHPNKSLLVYAGARMVGNRAVSYDLKIADLNGASRFITATQHSDERWPQWHPDGKQILYTIGKTTDLFLLDFQAE